MELTFAAAAKKTVKEACADKGLDYAVIEQELQKADQVVSTRPLPYNDWALDFLADYIVNTHHSYTKKQLPEIRGYAAKVARVHGDNHPELLEIYQLVEEVSAEMSAHMVKEEQILFPYIKEIVASKNKTAVAPQYNALGSVQGPISMMEMEHEHTGNAMEQIRTLSNNYSLPEDGCASYSLLFRMLEELEEDLHIHIHLENNILFPKALEMEKN